MEKEDLINVVRRYLVSQNSDIRRDFDALMTALKQSEDYE